MRLIAFENTSTESATDYPSKNGLQETILNRDRKRIPRPDS
jgi:hypothetical protein